MFQPIFEIGEKGQRLYAVEALQRGLHLDDVRREQKEVEVDSACLVSALQAASLMPSDCAITINVHAATLERDERWPYFIADIAGMYGIAMSQLIVEIVGQQHHQDATRFLRAVARLRSSTIRIALDDIGHGYSNYRLLMDLRPDLVKIDPYFVAGSQHRESARAAIHSIALLAKRLGAQVIAEGVDTESDLQSVLALGIRLVQGYYLMPPYAATSAAAGFSEAAVN